MRPALLVPSRALAGLNVLGGILAVTAAALYVLGAADAIAGHELLPRTVLGPATAILIAFWLLRLRQRTPPAWWTLPLLVIGEAAVAGFLIAHGGPARLLVGPLLGVVGGAPVWALVLVLLHFGVTTPHRWWREEASQGSAGADRGERLLALAHLLLAALTWWLANRLYWTVGGVGPATYFTETVAALATIISLVAAGGSVARLALRNRFVARVRAGAEPRYRIESRSLLRVEPAGEGYREAPRTDEVMRLDDEAAKPLLRRLRR